MAVTDLLFRPTLPARAQIGSIVLDAVISESHESDSTITKNPVETGSTISDHIYLEPKRVSVQGSISDTPVELFGGFIGLSQRRLEAFEQLLALQKSKSLFTLVTGLKVYPNMALARLSAPRDDTTGGRLVFTADCEEIELVNTETTQLSRDKIKAGSKDLGQSTTDTGKQATRKPTDSETGKVSLAKAGWKNLFGAK